MKTVLTRFLAIGSVPLLLLASCKKNDPIVKTNGGSAGTLSANTSTPVLDKTKLSDTTKVINFTFTKSTYEFSAAATNTLQIDAASDNWAHPTSVTLANGVSAQGYSTNDFNSMLLKLNLPAGTPAQIQARIQYSLGGASKPIYSNVLSLTATPFNLTSWLWITGQFSGWANQKTPSAEDSLVSVTGNGVYTGVINFPAGQNQFLILPVKGDWSHKYATNDPQGSTSATVTYDASNNLYAPSAGGQTIVTFNLNTGTITFAPANFYSLIGDGAVDWSTDIPMKYLNDGTSTWTATTTLKSSGSIKVRQNDDWTYSWGVPKAGSAGDGIANTLNDTSNNNISVPSTGTHTVTFTIPLSVQGSGSPPVTATYTLK